MNCPFCNKHSKVVDSRFIEKGKRRKRVCLSCKKKFSTMELYEKTEVILKDKGDDFEESLKEEEIDD